MAMVDDGGKWRWWMMVDVKGLAFLRDGEGCHRDAATLSNCFIVRFLAANGFFNEYSTPYSFSTNILLRSSSSTSCSDIAVMAPPISNQRDNSKVRGSEVFVGGLKRNVTEEAIREFFADCGEISEIRIMRDQAGAVKGYCFVRFTSKEASLKAQKTKNDTMFQGKKIGVNQSSDQYTLYLGGIRKDWSLEDFEKIVKQAFQDVQLVDLIMQPNVEETGNKRQRNRGFGFVDFVSHAAAARAYKMASREDFLLGGKHKVVVDWAEAQPEPDPDEIAKVKTAFIGNLPSNTSDEHLRVLLASFGKVERVSILRKSTQPIGFVEFSKRSELENAVKEMDGKLVDGPAKGPKFKISVSIAKPSADKSRKRAWDNSKIDNVVTNKTNLPGGLYNPLAAYPDYADYGLGKSQRVPTKPIEVIDPYDIVFSLLKPAVADRIKMLFHQGYGTRQEIDIHVLEGLRELPEAAAISALDQFALSSFGDSRTRSAYLVGVIDMTRRELAYAQAPLKGPSAVHDVGASSISRFPVIDPLAAANPDIGRYDGYSSFSTPSYLSSNLSIDPLLDAYSLPSQTVQPYSLPSQKVQPKLGSKDVAGVRQPLRFDPFTGEPYKFDPFTGEPVKHDRSMNKKSRGR